GRSAACVEDLDAAVGIESEARSGGLKLRAAVEDDVAGNRRTRNRAEVGIGGGYERRAVADVDWAGERVTTGERQHAVADFVQSKIRRDDAGEEERAGACHRDRRRRLQRQTQADRVGERLRVVGDVTGEADDVAAERKWGGGGGGENDAAEGC